MNIQNNLINAFLMALFAGVFVLVFFSGCGSVVDGDYAPLEAEGYHPFESIEDHGDYAAVSADRLSQCAECHGEDLHGVENGVILAGGEKDRSCYKCHNANRHPVPFSGTSRSHTAYLREHNWDIGSCCVCHANTVSEDRLSLGGSCSGGDCHSPSHKGPQDCNTCHGNSSGDFTNPVHWAPPEDLTGNTETNHPGVGVHRTHLMGNTGAARPVECKVCHIVPKEWDAEGHIEDDSPGKAEVVFHYPAVKGESEPVYNAENNTCASVYCHGDNSASWTAEGGWADCNSCHGMPPGGTHPQWASINQCYWCHGDVVDADGNIVEPGLHVNGGVN